MTAMTCRTPAPAHSESSLSSTPASDAQPHRSGREVDRIFCRVAIGRARLPRSAIARHLAVQGRSEEGQFTFGNGVEPPAPLIGVRGSQLEGCDPGQHVMCVDLGDRVEVGGDRGRIAMSMRGQQETGWDSQYGVVAGKR